VNLSKHYSSGAELSAKVLNGVNILADNVASTLGPRGRTVLLQQAGKRPFVSKDGVTVADHVVLDDPVENAAVHILKQASSQTNTLAGDGTTTSMVLARAILKEAQKHVVAGTPPIEIKRAIDRATEVLVENLREASTPIQSEEDIAHIASISANNDEVIGNLIAKAVDCVGKDGSITVEAARSTQTSLDLREGFSFDSGFVANAFVTDERRQAVIYDEPFILVADTKIDKVDQILPVLEAVAREGRPLVIVASEIVDQALAALIMNTVRGTMKIAAVKAPRYGGERRGILKDLCLATGAAFITKSGDMKLEDVKLSHLGTCEKVDIVKNSSTFIGGKGNYEDVEKQIEALKAEIDNTDNLHECERLQERITRLASGVAIIKVGAPTEAEMIEKRHRIEDALEAVKAAQQEGIVPGGGVALIRALPKKSGSPAERIVYEAVKEPIRQMARNSGESPDLILEQVQKAKGNRGYNFATGKMGNLLEEGVIDPVKVTITALTMAASAAGTLLTTGYAIIEGE
jgi:chaperonin GroEL